MPEPFIVMCAPNGARKTRNDHPALPMTASELGACAASIVDAGASIIHTHIRDDSGAHSLDVGRYRDAIRAIREAVGDRLVIQVTTEACGIYAADQQIAMVRELKPEAVSLALREICPDQAAEMAAAEFYAWLKTERIMAQHILYSPQEVERFEQLRHRGVIDDGSPFVLFVLGRYASNLTGDVAELRAFAAAAAPGTRWAVCCFGPTEHEAVAESARLGGHARVGFENNLQLADGAVAPDNAALVSAAVLAGRAEHRPPASAEDVRARFGGRAGTG